MRRPSAILRGLRVSRVALRPREMRVEGLQGAALLGLAMIAGCATEPSGRDLPPSARTLGSSASEGGRVISINDLGGFLGVGYLFTRERSSGSAIEKSEHRLQERAGLGVSGSVLSPNFLLYEATGVLGPSQVWGNDGTGTRFDDGLLSEGEADARFFPKRWHPAELYFSRIQDFQPRVYLSTLESTTTTARGTQSFNGSDGTLRLEATHRDLEQKTFGTEEAPFLDVTEDVIGASGDYRLTDRQSVTGSYNFQEVRQAVTENSFNAHNMLGTHSWKLGEEKSHELRTRAEALLQQGSLDQKLLRAEEMFDSEITEDLRGGLGFHAEDNETNLLDHTILNGDGTLRHQLFESLTTTLRAEGGRNTTNSESTTDYFGGTGSLLYHKKTPFGVVRSSYRLFFERRLVAVGPGGAIDEPHTFPLNPPEEFRLLQPRIDLSSIRVTDATRLQIYRERLDYSVTQDAAGFTTITRIFTGLIPPGAEVLVTYAFEVGSDYTLDTLANTFQIEHEFTGGLTPYFSIHKQDQNVSDVQGVGGIQEVDERVLIGGVEWRFPSYTLGGEYENHESTVLPFDAIRLKAQGSLQLTSYQQLMGDATQSWLYYEDPTRDVSVTQGTLRWRLNLEKRTQIFADAALRYEDDSIQGSSYGYGFSLGAEYRWRLFTFRLRASHRRSQGANSVFEGEEIGIWLVREFGAPPPSTVDAKRRFLRQ